MKNVTCRLTGDDHHNDHHNRYVTGLLELKFYPRCLRPFYSGLDYQQLDNRRTSSDSSRRPVEGRSCGCHSNDLCCSPCVVCPNHQHNNEMFKFNFSSPADQNDETKIDSTPDSDHSVTNDNVLVAHEVQLSENHRKNAEAAEISLLTITNCSFRHVNLKQVEELICSENSSIISDALKVNSDVVKGVYEGKISIL